MQTFQHFKPLKPIERSEVMERFELRAAKHVLSPSAELRINSVEGDAKGESS